MIPETDKYKEQLALAHRAVERVIFQEETKGKVVIFIDPDKDGYITRVETVIVE